MQDSSLLEQLMVEPTISPKEKGIDPIIPRGLGNSSSFPSQSERKTVAIDSYDLLGETLGLPLSSHEVYSETNSSFTDRSETYTESSSLEPKPTGTATARGVQRFSDDEAVPPERHSKSLELIPNYRSAKACANCAFSIYDPALGHGLCEKWKAPVCPSYVCDSHLDPNTLLAQVAEEEPTERYTEQSTISPKIDTFYSSSQREAREEVQEEKSFELFEKEQGNLLKEEVERIVEESKTGSDSKYADQELFNLAFESSPTFTETEINEVLKKMYAERRYEKDFKQKYGLDKNPYNI